MTNVWWVPLATALAGFLGTLLGSFFTRQTEQQKWLREQRLRAYTEYWTAMREATQYLYQYWNINPMGDEAHNWVQLSGQARDAHFVASLIATQAVAQAMNEHRRAMLLGQWPMRDRGTVQDGARRIDEAGLKFHKAVRAEFGLAADVSFGLPLNSASAPSVDNLDR